MQSRKLQRIVENSNQIHKKTHILTIDVENHSENIICNINQAVNHTVDIAI